MKLTSFEKNCHIVRRSLNFASIDDFPFYMRWENAGVTSLNHIMDTVTKKFLTLKKIKTLIKSNNTLISNIPTDIKKCLKDNIDNINTENVQPIDDFLDRLINIKSLKFAYITLLKTLRDGPFNLKGEEEGVCFFSKKNILNPNVAEKNIDFGGGKKNLIQCFCHIT